MSKALTSAEAGDTPTLWVMARTTRNSNTNRTAAGAVETTRRLEALSNEDRLLFRTQGRRAGSALRVLEVLRSRRLLTLTIVLFGDDV